mgnify:CR=1 FL=1
MLFQPGSRIRLPFFSFPLTAGLRCCILAHNMRKRTLLASLIVWLCSLLLAALVSPSSGRASSGSNLLQNPGFEEGKEGWSKFPSAATFVVTDTTQYVHGGRWAASLNRTDWVGGEIYIYQDVPVLGGQFYSLSGWAYKNDSGFSCAKLRIEWKDAALQTINDEESHLLAEDEDAYHLLCIPRECNGDGVQAPNNAVKARIEGVAIIVSPNPPTPVFFDDLSFTFQGSKVYLPLIVKNY